MEDVHQVPIDDVLDLHAFAPADIASVVEEYVRAAHEGQALNTPFVHVRLCGVPWQLVPDGTELAE